jgi:hypothetical protein
MPDETTFIKVIQEPSLIEVINQPNFITVPGIAEIITIGTQGPPGPPGTGAFFQVIAGEDITAFTVVVIVNGLLYQADPTNAAYGPLVAGIATIGGIAGQSINVVQEGEIDGMTGLVTDARYYAGTNGALSTSPTVMSFAWRRSMGVAKSTTQFIILPAPSILS